MNATIPRYRLYYDEDDYRLLEMVNKIISRGKMPTLLRKLFDPGLHPRGIKELGAPKTLRIASAMIDLLRSLEQGTPAERLTALRAVRAEALHDSSQGLRMNAARLLLQIMKEIVKAHGDTRAQLALARDFREVSSGKPRLIRKQLRKYHLLEMPEAWNQLAFDHHVHDAHTKGRKSPTHLIMDAWIKGIRYLGVIYYYHVKPDVAAELLEAAHIMGIQVRIGIEVAARLRGKFVHFIWTPRGFQGSGDFLHFLKDPGVRAFFDLGMEAVECEKNRVLQLLDCFNRVHLPGINDRFGIRIEPLQESDFIVSVGHGQASLVHLAEFIFRSLHPHLQQQIAELSEQCNRAAPSEQSALLDRITTLSEIDSESIVEKYLRPDANPELPDPSIPSDDLALPEILKLDTPAMLDRLDRLPCRSRITLNPSNLSPADVLEVLYEGKGRITHLEIFNLKDWSQGRTGHRSRINEIRLVINSGNVVNAKRLVREILAEEESGGVEGTAGTIAKLHEILRNLNSLLGFYRVARLQSRLGSDSIGHSRHTRGMGLVVVPTLPWRARRELSRMPGRMIPVTTLALRNVMTVSRRGKAVNGGAVHHSDHPSPAVATGRLSRRVTWTVGENSTTLSGSGNIATLGGQPDRKTIYPGLSPMSGIPRKQSQGPPPLSHLSTRIINVAKVVLGFLPAFLTFVLTKDWWVLAWFGAFLWFGITGFRNILQAVIGGGGLRRSSLLKWKSLVSWSRIADSLLFTGFSVPILDFLVKDVLLDRGLNINTATAPVMLFSVIALANGIYISSHNIYRGLPILSVIGNLFRTILSIPVAVTIDTVVLHILMLNGLPAEAAAIAIQPWAAIISKIASDFVAALIEGTADRLYNLAHRRVDYSEKLAQVYEVYGLLETTFPEQDVLALLAEPKDLFKTLLEKNPDLHREMVINSLDLLYFWMYQPRAPIALLQNMKTMTRDERQFLLESQNILKRKRVISEMLLQGLVGKKFETALAFYLSYADRYLQALIRRSEKL